jgi:amidase
MKIATEAQEYREASILQVSSWQVPNPTPRKSTDFPAKALTQKDFEITQRPPEDLITLLANGDLKALDVTTSFLRSAALAQKLVFPRNFHSLFLMKYFPISMLTYN